MWTNVLQRATPKRSTLSPYEEQYCIRNVAINIQSDSIVRQTNKVHLLKTNPRITIHKFSLFGGRLHNSLFFFLNNCVINEFWFHKLKLPQTDAQDWQRVTIMWQLLRKKKRKKDLWCTITFFFLECELKNYYLFFEPAFTGIKKKNLNPTTGMFYASLHLARATWNQFSYCIGCSRKEEQTHDDKWMLVYSTKGKPWRRIRNSATHTDHRSNISGI